VHPRVERERADSVVDVGCRNFFLRLGMTAVSLGTTEPGVPRGKGSTDGMRGSGFPLKEQLQWVQGGACERPLPHRSAEAVSPGATPARLRESPARTSIFGGDRQEPWAGLVEVGLQPGSAEGRACTCTSSFSAGVNRSSGRTQLLQLPGRG